MWAHFAGAASAVAGAIVADLKTAGIETTPDKEIIALTAYLQRLGRDGTAAVKAREAAATTPL